MTSRFIHWIRRVIPQLKHPSPAPMGSKSERMVWVDMEMTGLDVNRDHILEIACIITDKELSLVAEGPNIIIHQPEEILQSMNDWCIDHHGQSGLTEASRHSHVSLGEAEQQMLEFVTKYVPPGRCPLAGNTVHMDKRFLDKYMPQFMQHLHYRIIDVSSVKELYFPKCTPPITLSDSARRWYPKEFCATPKKELKHRAVEDIRESIAELKYYRETIFKQRAGSR